MNSSKSPATGMNPQEYVVLRRFLAQLVRIRRVKKDPEADALVQEAVTQQPDAAYLLTERVLLLGVALDRARARVAKLESELQRTRNHAHSSAATEPLARPREEAPLPEGSGSIPSIIAPSFGDD